MSGAESKALYSKVQKYNVCLDHNLAKQPNSERILVVKSNRNTYNENYAGKDDRISCTQ